jgi:hypothetical protein
MDPQHLIVLYSKYSPQCQQLLDVYTSEFPFIQMVCIDHHEIRERIQTQWGVQTVPCVILLGEKGDPHTMEKFEGPNVMSWLLKQLSNGSSDHTTPIEKVHEPIPDSSTVQEKIPQGTTPIDLDMGDPSVSAIQDDQLVEPVYEMESLPNRPLSVVEEQSLQPISLSERASHMAQERETLIPAHPPHVTVPTGPLSSSFSSSLSEGVDPSSKRMSLSERASHMAKERETSIPIHGNNGTPI